jgi:DNA replication protein DnaC
MTPKPNDLAEDLRRLGLRSLPSTLDDFLAVATKSRWPPRQLLQQLVQQETEDRARRGVERRLRLSGIRNIKPMADFDWNWPKAIERDVIERALTLGFLGDNHNLVLIGPNGVGKTMIARNLCYSAVQAGCTVAFHTAASLIDELQRASPDGRRRKLRYYANVGLLCIDEIGYLSFDSHAADLLFEVINRRHGRKPVIVTTNRVFKEWNEIFPNATCIVAMLDRLLHHADVTVIDGDSYRHHESEIEAAARRKRK